MRENLQLKPVSGAIRLTLSAKVANDLGSLREGLKSLAERMGHPACATGCDVLHLMMERDLFLNDEVQLNPQPLPPRWLDTVAPPQTASTLPSVKVSLPDEGFNDIETLTKAVEITLDKLGCPACCSGFDIAFQRELDLIAFDKDLNVQGFGNFR